MAKPFYGTAAQTWFIKVKVGKGDWINQSLTKGPTPDKDANGKDIIPDYVLKLVETTAPQVTPLKQSTALSEYVRAWLKRENKKVADGTIKQRTNAFDSFLSYCSSAGLTTLAEIKGKDLIRWVEGLRVKSPQRPNGAKDTIKSMLGCIGPLFNYAIQMEDYHHANPVTAARKTIKLPKEVVTKAPTKEEQALLLEEVKRRGPDWLYDISQIMLRSGLRVSAALAMEFSWVGDEIIKIPAKHSKTGREIITVLEPEAKEAIERRRKVVGVCDGNAVQKLFPEPEQKYTAVYHRLKSRVRTSGISNRGSFCHALRHGFACNAVEDKVPLNAIQKALGHSSITMTERYAKTSVETMVSAFKAKSPPASA